MAYKIPCCCSVGVNDVVIGFSVSAFVITVSGCAEACGTKLYCRLFHIVSTTLGFETRPPVWSIFSVVNTDLGLPITLSLSFVFF